MISKIKLQRFLLIAGVTRYLEFKSIEGSYVMGKSGKISKVGHSVINIIAIVIIIFRYSSL